MESCFIVFRYKFWIGFDAQGTSKYKMSSMIKVINVPNMVKINQKDAKILSKHKK